MEGLGSKYLILISPKLIKPLTSNAWLAIHCVFFDVIYVSYRGWGTVGGVILHDLSKMCLLFSRLCPRLGRGGRTLFEGDAHVPLYWVYEAKDQLLIEIMSINP